MFCFGGLDGGVQGAYSVTKYEDVHLQFLLFSCMCHPPSRKVS